MTTTLALKGDPCAKAGRGRTTPEAIQVVEAVVQEIAKLDNCADRLEKTVEFLAHIRRVGGQLESDLVRVVREIYRDEIPDLKHAASLAESLYLLDREAAK